MNWSKYSKFKACAELPKNILYFSVVFFLWLLVYFEALISAGRIWYISEIFTHGFFILPGSFYFIWKEREKLKLISPSPNYWVSLLLLPFLFLGVFGRAGGVDVFMHISAFTVLPLMIWLIFGNQVARIIWFPLLFMLFSIPIGEELVPLLQKLTADMAIFMLNLTSVPSFNSGLYIEIPEGKFVVAEACSGIRFFVGSIVFGAVYSHLSYYAFKRKLAFMCLAVVVPIFANALRVFTIVLIGHYVDMEYASGADHLVYGWVFFSIVLFLLVIIGETFRDHKKQADTDTVNTTKVSLDQTTNQVDKQALALTASALLVVFFWSLNLGGNQDSIHSELNRAALGDQFKEKPLDKAWSVKFEGPSDLVSGYLNTKSYQMVNLTVVWYPQNKQGHELISSSNSFFDKQSWSLNSETKFRLSDELNVGLLDIVSLSGQKRLVLYWYQLSQFASANRMKIKMQQAFDTMMGNSGAGSVVVLSLPYNQATREDVRDRLLNEASALAPTILSVLPFE